MVKAVKKEKKGVARGLESWRYEPGGSVRSVPPPARVSSFLFPLLNTSGWEFVCAFFDVPGSLN